jgi:hypothetical protein
MQPAKIVTAEVFSSRESTMNHLATLCGILSLAACAACGNSGVTDVKILNCGEIEGTPSGRTTAAPQTALGYVNVMPELDAPRFKPGCPKIEAAIGTRFGIQVVAKGPAVLEIVPLVTRVTHPEIRNPQQQPSTVEQWSSPLNSGIPRYAGWQFDQPWELVAGRWRIEILDSENTVVAAQDFDVTLKK